MKLPKKNFVEKLYKFIRCFSFQKKHTHYHHGYAMGSIYKFRPFIGLLNHLLGYDLSVEDSKRCSVWLLDWHCRRHFYLVAHFRSSVFLLHNACWSTYNRNGSLSSASCIDWLALLDRCIKTLNSFINRTFFLFSIFFIMSSSSSIQSTTTTIPKKSRRRVVEAQDSWTELDQQQFNETQNQKDYDLHFQQNQEWLLSLSSTTSTTTSSSSSTSSDDNSNKKQC